MATETSGIRVFTFSIFLAFLSFEVEWHLSEALVFFCLFPFTGLWEHAVLPEV